MSYLAILRASAAVLSIALLSSGAVRAQDAPQPLPHTMTDTAPLPATERDSNGAVILMDQPVLAQRAAMQAAAERSAADTRSMGAGPARVLQRVLQEDQQRALDAGKTNPATPR